MKPSRLCDYLYFQKENHPLKKSFSRKEGNSWKSWSTDEMIDQANKLSAGLLELGLKAGDKVAVVSYKNRPEWMIVDQACQQIGVIDVPLYSTISPREYEYILNDAEVKYAFVGADDLFDKVSTAQQNVPSLKGIYTLDKQKGKPFWEDIWRDDRRDEIKKRMDAIDPETLATIIYTSGTTGKPKGVSLNHRNICFIVDSTESLLPSEAGNQVLSFLPLCHIFERTVSYAYINKSQRVYFTGTDNLGGPNGDLADVKPYFFTTVPRLLEKVYEAIYNKGLDLTGMKRKLFFWALSLADDYSYDQKLGGLTALKWSIADKLIFSKWRDALGGNVTGIVTGAAPCPVKIAKVFSAAGIPIREGYGLTETSPTLTVNTYEPGGAMAGTVGAVLDGVKIQIDRSEGEYREGEGEIIAHGPNIMMGYYNRPDANAAVFKDIKGERWFKTGDVGKFVDGPGGVPFLKITDRKKELLKTSGGKYVAPAPIEGKLRENFLVEQCMVVGDKRKFVSAVIVPAEAAVKDWCDNNSVKWTNLEDACKNEKVIAEFQKGINEVNPDFSHIEQVKKFCLLPKTWDAVKADGSAPELTPTMKLKRRVIREKYGKEIDALYS